jgi:hypothetical protein
LAENDRGAPGEVLGVAAVAVAEAGTQAVGAVLRRHPTAKGKSVLQSLGQGNKALTAVDHRHMAPARIGQAEVEQPVLQHLPRHGDRLAFDQREIRDPQHPGPMLLQEHHLLIRPM